jgi:hypothetical protein
MKRLLVLLAALAVTSTVVATSAFAGGTGSTTCSGDLGGQKITGNLVVPAGTVCGMWGEVTGNVTVQGVLKSFGATFDKNVTVDGGAFKSLNWGTTIKGNLTINNSAGDTNPNDTNANGFFAPYSPSHIFGNFTYTGNSAPLYVGESTTVDGNFTFNTNTSWLDIPQLDVNGAKNIA